MEPQLPLSIQSGKSQKNFPLNHNTIPKRVESLEFHIISSSIFSQENERLNNTYQFWTNSWKKTFQQLDVEKNEYSDDFLNKEIGCLFLGVKPVGLLMYHYIDLQMPCFLNSSYFTNYPKFLLDSISKYSGTTMIITYMTLDKEWRRRQTTYPISELLISFSVLRLLESPAQRILGYFRNDRGTQNIFYRHGGVPLLRNARAYNVDIDFALINKEQANLSKRGGCNELALRKWNEFKLNQKGETNEHNFKPRSIHEASSRVINVSAMGRREFL